MAAEEEYARYWEEKKSQYHRALNFMAEAKAGETYHIERYAIPQTGIPHALSEYANAPKMYKKLFLHKILQTTSNPRHNYRLYH